LLNSNISVKKVMVHGVNHLPECSLPGTGSRRAEIWSVSDWCSWTVTGHRLYQYHAATWIVQKTLSREDCRGRFLFAIRRKRCYNVV